MALTGYCFENFSEIEPFLESPSDGPTSRFCSLIARRLQCHVICGYPEALCGYSEARGSHGLAANSAMVISPEGSVLGNYRKSNLYELDKSWAESGEESIPL